MRVYNYIFLFAAALPFCANLALSAPKDALAKKHVSFGNAAIEEADYQRAVEHYESALKEDPDSKSVM